MPSARFEPSIRLSAWNSLPQLCGFSKKFYVIIFRKSIDKIQVSLQSDNNNGTLHEERHTFPITSRSVPLRMRNVSDKSCRENQNTFCVQYFFFRKSRRLWDNGGKCCGAGKVTDDNMAHAHCMLDI